MNVFISYRRNDTKHAAARVASCLEEMSNIGNVFIDVSDIGPGTIFKEEIEQALKRTDVCLVIIGDSWRGAEDNPTHARIFEEGDFVRLEVAMALASGKRVIPVLVDGAKMPNKNSLPVDLQPVVNLNAALLRHNSFERDMEGIDDAIHLRKKRSPIDRILRRNPLVTLFLKVLSGALATVVFIVALAVLHNVVTGKSINQTLNSSGTVVWIITGIGFLIGVAASVWLALRQNR